MSSRCHAEDQRREQQIHMYQLSSLFIQWNRVRQNLLCKSSGKITRITGQIDNRYSLKRAPGSSQADSWGLQWLRDSNPTKAPKIQATDYKIKVNPLFSLKDAAASGGRNISTL